MVDGWLLSQPWYIRYPRRRFEDQVSSAFTVEKTMAFAMGAQEIFRMVSKINGN